MTFAVVELRKSSPNSSARTHVRHDNYCKTINTSHVTRARASMHRGKNVAPNSRDSCTKDRLKQIIWIKRV